MIKLATLYDPLLLLQLQHELENANIPYWIKNGQVQGLFGHLHYPNPAVGPYEIWVPKEIAKKAREILDSVFLEEMESICTFCAQQDAICPICGREE
jgi:hypothetical protein